MEVWQIILFGVAALLAVQTLVALMTAHKSRLEAEIAAREEQERREAKKRAKAEAETAAKNRPRRNAPAA